MSLYRNIAAKKKRIKAGSGETMKKAGVPTIPGSVGRQQRQPSPLKK